jgi:pectate lyase
VTWLSFDFVIVSQPPPHYATRFHFWRSIQMRQPTLPETRAARSLSTHVTRISAVACLFLGACAVSSVETGTGGTNGGGTAGTSGGTAGTSGGTAGTTGGTAGTTGGTAGTTGGTAGTTGGTAGTSGGTAGTTGGTAGTTGGSAGTTGGTAGTTGSGGTSPGGAGRGGSGGRAGTTGGTAGTTGSAGRGGTQGTAGTVGAAGTTGAGGSGSCSSTTPPAASALVGWASVSGNGTTTTTGGGSAAPQTVTSVSALNAAAGGSNAAVIYVSGVFPNGNIKIGSNKTIVGLCGAELHGHVDVVGSSNVIIRNIKIVGYAVGNCALDPSYDSSVGCSSGNDAVTVEQGHHIWFDHDDISDGTDGNLDITLAANYVTVSWCKFHYTARTDNTGSDSTGGAGHRYSSLVGGGDNSPGDVGKLNVTWHHNWWADRVVERQPRVRYGQNHLFNNLWTSSGDNYCVRAGMDAMILVENNAFVGVKSPQEFNSTADQMTSYITATNNLYSGTSGNMSTGGGGTPFTNPPYTYQMDAASAVQAEVQAGAGPQ